MATNDAVNSPLSGTTGTGNFVGSTSPTLVTPNIGVATATTLAFSPTTNGIIGTTTNDSAATGKVGEFVTSNVAAASAVTVTTGQANDMTTISLHAGDWDVWGNILVRGTTVTNCSFWISTTSATIPDLSLVNNLAPVSGATAIGMSAPNIRLSLSTTTTVYISCAPSGTGTLTACGTLSARVRR